MVNTLVVAVVLAHTDTSITSECSTGRYHASAYVALVTIQIQYKAFFSKH